MDGDDDMERRRLMRDAATATVGAAIAPVLATLTDAWQQSAPAISGATVSQAMLDDWEEAADVHMTRAFVEPPAVILAALAVDFAGMAPHLKQRQPEGVHRGLAHAAARHSALIAGKWFDLGNRREARRWWATTRTLAGKSGDNLLAAWLMTWESAYRWHDDSDDLSVVLDLTQEARRLAGERPSAPLVAAMCSKAWGLTRLGRHAEAVEAIQQAADVFGRLPSQVAGVDPGWAGRGMWFDLSLVYTLAGRKQQAESAQDAATAAFPAGHRTLTQLALHRAALQARTDPEQGALEASRIVDRLPVERRDTRILSAARITLAVLPEDARKSPAARELRELTSGF
ncbi:hypothetical protein DP939_45055 [Spongiactinospora rosea]|uniref:XRE family transcriptional regulator n=2 Tax=Spongiactinospora rosea TaxID=2248750 RepID=A0A366LEB9_9ACTN|nr:hypothetical protein DP939_45055 [Spongiactinospora rosea]